MTMNFRKDIGGLRAIAVLMVVLYHFKVPFFEGGFSGVDIFFVISGFLMSSIYLRKVETGVNGVISFYKARFNRIYPALIFAILATYVFLYLTESPFIVTDFFTEAKYAALFSSNIFYQFNSGYFDVSSDLRWLLHTWSLSVEWQFYMIYPLVIFAVFKTFGHRHIMSTYLLVLFVSAGLCFYISKSEQNFAFYSLATRSWELMAGALISLATPPERSTGRLLELSGLSLILYSLFFITSTSNWPNHSAIVPVSGACLLIYSSLSNKESLLRFWPMQFIGKISYSWYLWHWIVVAYMNNHGMDFTLQNLLSGIALSMLLACASYFLIEKNAGKNTKIIAISSMACICLISVSYVFVYKKIETILAYEHYPQSEAGKTQFGGECFLTSAVSSFSQYNKGKCLTKANDKPNILIIGDSHAAQLYTAVRDRFSGYHIMQATASGCKPYLDPVGEKRCTDMINFIYNDYLVHNKIDKVIVSGYWYETNSRDPEKKIVALYKKLSQLSDDVVIVGQTKVFKEPFYRVAQSKSYEMFDNFLDMNVDKFRSVLVTRIYDYNVNYVDAYNFGCESGCTMQKTDGSLFMFDKDHLTKSGADAVVSLIN